MRSSARNDIFRSFKRAYEKVSNAKEEEKSWGVSARAKVICYDLEILFDNYVRKSFDLGLPHPTVIRSWYSSMNGEPGFTQNAMAALKAKVLAARRDNQEVVWALMLDEMSIRKHGEWDGKQFRGYVDLGTGINDDSLRIRM